MAEKMAKFLYIFLAGVLVCSCFAGKLTPKTRGRESAYAKKLFSETPFEAMVQGRRQREQFFRHERISRRRRLVDINFEHISSLKPRQKASLALNLFSGESFEFQPSRIMRRTGTNFTWFGTLKGLKGSSAGLTVYKGSMYGRILTGDGRMFGVAPGPAGLHEIVELDPAGFVEDPNDAVFPDPQSLLGFRPDTLRMQMDNSGSGTTLSMPNPSTADGRIIDVIILYSDDVVPYPSSEFSDVMSMIWAAVDWTNLTYQNSELDIRIRPVYIEMINYNEPTYCSTALFDLRDADGVFSNVPYLRTTYGGDLVSLILNKCDNSNGPICGSGFQFSDINFPEYFAEYSAFSVVKDECSAWSLTLGHEIGHNQGLFHAQGDSGGAGLFDYSFGNRFGTAAQPEFYRTIMAYWPGWRMPCLSDPNVPYTPDSSFSYGLEPDDPLPAYITGTPGEADNARTLLESAPYVANYRDSVYNLNPNYFGFAQFAARWGSSNCEACGGADFSLDHSVNVEDMPIFGARWLSDALP